MYFVNGEYSIFDSHIEDVYLQKIIKKSTQHWLPRIEIKPFSSVLHVNQTICLSPHVHTRKHFEFLNRIFINRKIHGKYFQPEYLNVIQ